MTGAAEYWRAVEANDAPRALAVAETALAEHDCLPGGSGDGALVEQVLADLVIAAQRRVGDAWARNTLSVAQEHAATAVSEYVVRSLLARYGGRTAGATDLGGTGGVLAAGSGPGDVVIGGRSVPTVVVACAEREWHALPGLVLATALAARDVPVLYLGSDVSTRTLQGILLDEAVRAVLVSASLSPALLYVRRHVETATQSGIPTVVGGSAFDPAGRRAAALGATAQAASADDAVAVLADLPVRVPAAPRLSGAGVREGQQLAPRVNAVARAACARVLETVPVLAGRRGGSGDGRADADEDGTAEHLEDVLADQMPVLVGCVVAALLTDDPTVVSENWSWFRQVVRARGADDELLARVEGALRDQLRDFPAAAEVWGGREG